MAQAGDSKARDFTAKYILGEAPRTLFELAKLDAAGFDTAREISTAVEYADTAQTGDAAVLAMLAGAVTVNDN